MARHRLQVPYSGWEIVAIGLWMAAAACLTVWALTTGRTVLAIFWIGFAIGGIVWDVYLRSTHPEFFAQRRKPSTQLLAAAVLVCVFLVGVLLLHQVAAQIGFAFATLAVVASVRADRTRPLPDQSVTIGREQAIKRHRTTVFVVAAFAAAAVSWVSDDGTVRHHDHPHPGNHLARPVYAPRGPN